MELVSLIEGDVSELRIKMHFGFLIRGGRLIELTPEKVPPRRLHSSHQQVNE